MSWRHDKENKKERTARRVRSCCLFCLFCQLDGLDRVWDLDAFFAEAGGQCFDEFVSKDTALGDVVGGEDDVEVDARRSEGLESDERFVGGVRRLLFHDGCCDFDADALYVFEVAVVADTARYGEEYLTARKVVVHECRRRYCLIRYDDHTEVDVLYRGVSEVDIDDESFFAC